MKQKIVNELLENFKHFLPILEYNRDLGEELRKKLLGEDKENVIPDNFDVIKKNQDILCEFIRNFENIAKSKYMKVNLGQGSTNYRTILLAGLKSKNYNDKNKKFKNEIIPEKFDILKITHEFLMEIRNIKKNYSKSNDILDEIIRLNKKDEFFKFSSIKSYLIKLFACIFPETLLPIFKDKHLKEFINIIGIVHEKNDNIEDKFEKTLKLSFFLKEYIQNHKIFDIIDLSKYHSVIQTNFIYRYLRLFEENNYSSIWNELKKLGFNSYPNDEYSTLGLFMLMLKSKDYNGFWGKNGLKNLYDINFLKISDDFPDLIGFIPNEVKGEKPKLIYIELEYLRSGYKHEKDETEEIVDNLYVVCWKNDKQGDGISKNKNRIIALKKIMNMKISSQMK